MFPCIEYSSKPLPFVINIFKYFPRVLGETRASLWGCCHAGMLQDTGPQCLKMQGFSTAAGASVGGR